MANQDKVDLFDAFGSSATFRKVFEKLLNQTDPTVALLALGGLFRLESDVGKGQFAINKEGIRGFLRSWRNDDNDSGYDTRTKRVLRELTIFKTNEVPLFIDDYGTKNVLSSYEETEDVDIGLDQPIYHVTHFEEAMTIANSKEVKASDKKNIMKGTWFGLESPGSVYGSRAFKTTLSKLGVGGLRQGEIVSYKHEVNVILYADNEGDTDGVKKPTDEATWIYHNNFRMYVKVSIFVPKRFLPEPDDFDEIISGPFRVKHDPFCVREKRTHKRCFELFYEDVMETVRCNADPATIFREISLQPGVTAAKKIRAVVKAFLELCLPDSSLSKEDRSENLDMATKHLLPVISKYLRVLGNRTKVLEAIESGFVTSIQASGDKTGDEDVMEIVRSTTNPDTITRRINSRFHSTPEEKIRAVVKPFMELCLPDSSSSKEDQSDNLEMATKRLLPVISKYLRVLGNRTKVLEAIEIGFVTSIQASDDKSVYERDDDNDSVDDIFT